MPIQYATLNPRKLLTHLGLLYYLIFNVKSVCSPKARTLIKLRLNAKTCSADVDAGVGCWVIQRLARPSEAVTHPASTPDS